MKCLSSFASVLLASTLPLLAVAPAMATPQPQEGRGMLPDLILLKFADGRMEEVSNPSRAAGGRPHEVVAADKGIPTACQAWQEIPSRPGFGYAAQITQICGN